MERVAVRTHALMREPLKHTLFAHSGIVIADGVSTDILTRAHEVINELFARKDLASQIPYRNDTRTGYTGEGIEKVHGFVDEHRHCFDYVPDNDPRMESIGLGELYVELTKLAHYVLATLDTRVAIPSKKGRHVLRVAEYTNREVNPETILYPRHKDFGLITLFVGGEDQGLQFEHEGVWQDANLGPGQVLVGAGTILNMYYPHDILALYHRVVAASPRRRSIFLFYEMEPATLLPNGETAERFNDRLMRLIRKDA